MDFRFQGLSAGGFSHLFGLSDDDLKERGMRRMVVDEKPGFPCRVTLQDAEPGERVLLLPFEHLPVHSPYRASGPIFVREAMRATFDRAGHAPEILSGRKLSVRAYAHDGMMVDADVAEGDGLMALLERLFGSAETEYAHIHFARRGCYACRVERA
jgi:hypothetical protein